MEQKIKDFVEHFIVDTQQILEHVCGINEVTHHTRACLFCNPLNPKMQFQKPAISVLPATFPSDLEYEMIKLKPQDRSNNLSGKQLVLINDEEYGNRKSMSQRPVFIKEIMLLLYTLGYSTFNPMPLYLTHTKNVIADAKKPLDFDFMSPILKDQAVKKQKFVFLCWGGFDTYFLQQLLLVCNPISSQIVLWIIDKPEEERKHNKDTLDLQYAIESVFIVHFLSIRAVKRFHYMLLTREGRLSVEDVNDYAKIHDSDLKTYIGASEPDQSKRRQKLSFIY
jgi:hypothetical protein